MEGYFTTNDRFPGSRTVFTEQTVEVDYEAEIWKSVLLHYVQNGQQVLYAVLQANTAVDEFRKKFPIEDAQ